MTKIVGLIGSVSGTKTRIAMETLKNQFSDVDFEMFDLQNMEMFFADGRDYRDYSGDTQRLVDAIISADALILGMPVYQGSIPGALKNVLDLMPIDSLRDKVVGIVVTSGSEKHYLVAQYQLIPILQYMKASILESYVFMDGSAFGIDDIIDDDVQMRLERMAYQTIEKVDSQRDLEIKREALFDF